MTIGIAQLPQVAHAIVLYMKEHRQAEGASCLLLTGDLGAGKTTLVQHIARDLGIEKLVPSPTFVIMKSYETADRDFSLLVHIDAYRLENKKETGALKLAHVYANPRALVCIEWPQRLEGEVPGGSVAIRLEVASESERTLILQGDLEGYIEKALQI